MSAPVISIIVYGFLFIATIVAAVFVVRWALRLLRAVEDINKKSK